MGYSRDVLRLPFLTHCLSGGKGNKRSLHAANLGQAGDSTTPSEDLHGDRR